MHGPTLDVTSHPDRRYRIDAFSVPTASRAEFEAAMHRNLVFIAKQPGFLDHVVFEKTTGPTTFDIVTMAIWDSQGAIDAASASVRAYYQQIGFDMPATMARLGITASLGYYQAPAGLQ